MILRNFWNDKETKTAVKEYLIAHLTEEAVKKVFNREDTGGVAEAREIIESAFAQLDLMFEPKVVPNVENEAR